MDTIIISSIALIALYICSVIYGKIKNKLIGDHESFNQFEREQIYTEEINRRKKVLTDISLFLTRAIFLKPFAKMGGENVFQYILTEERFYEFSDFMPENNQKLGLDEQLLCFQKCMYTRVIDSEKIIKILNEVKEDGLKAEKVKVELGAYLEKGLEHLKKT